MFKMTFCSETGMLSASTVLLLADRKSPVDQVVKLGEPSRVGGAHGNNRNRWRLSVLRSLFDEAIQLGELPRKAILAPQQVGSTKRTVAGA